MHSGPFEDSACARQSPLVESLELCFRWHSYRFVWGHMRRRSDLKNVRQIIAFSLTIAAALVLLLVPVYSGVQMTSEGPEQVTTSTLLEIVGPYVFVPLLIPVALTGLPLLMRGRAQKYASIVTTVALAIFTLIASATIGWFYVPALAAALTAVVALSRKPLNTSGPSLTAGQP